MRKMFCSCQSAKEGVSDGFASLHVGHDGKILGATIVGPNAGDHISEVTLCMQHNITADELAGTIHPYPTAAEVVRQAAQAYVRSRIFQPSNQELLRRMTEPCESIRSECSESGLRTILLPSAILTSIFGSFYFYSSGLLMFKGASRVEQAPSSAKRKLRL